MRVEPLELSGLLLIRPRVFEDARGCFFESYHEAKFSQAGILPRFVQDNQSHSRCGVLRGLHAQLERPQGKLVRALRGEIFDVAVDIRPDSPSFGDWAAVRLSESNRLQLWVPVGFAHGFCAVSEVTDVLYKTTTLYDADDEIGIRWDDPEIAIDWPLADPELSVKDSELPLLAELRPRLEASAAYRVDEPSSPQ